MQMLQGDVFGWVFDGVQGLRQNVLQEDSRAGWCLAGLGTQVNFFQTWAGAGPLMLG
jgi:hypothetical protein